MLSQGTVPLHGCTAFTGVGEVIPVPDEKSKTYVREQSWGNSENMEAWGR